MLRTRRVSLSMEALSRFRSRLLDGFRSRIGNTDHGGVTLLFQLVCGLGGGPGGDHYPRGFVVRRVDERFVHLEGVRLR